MSSKRYTNSPGHSIVLQGGERCEQGHLKLLHSMVAIFGCTQTSTSNSCLAVSSDKRLLSLSATAFLLFGDRLGGSAASCPSFWPSGEKDHFMVLFLPD